MVYFADLFQRFNVQGVTGNESCFDIIGPKCIHYLTVQVQSGDLLKAECSGVVEVPTNTGVLLKYLYGHDNRQPDR